jgi:hypothetical protein
MSKLVYAGLALVLFMAGCSSEDGGHTSAKVFQMGERVQAGSLVYTVLDTEWLDQLGDPANPRMPLNHFLSVRVSVTNSSTTTSGIPPMMLVDSRNQTYPELNDAKGLQEWLGYLRTVRPAETVHGRVLFDVPTASYRLKVTDDAEPEERKAALVELPLQLTRPQVSTEVPAGQ